MEKKVTNEVVLPHYDPIRDIKPVSQTGFVDIVKANSMNSLPSNLNCETLVYNEIDDPRSIAGRPRDSFESAQGAKAITDYTPPKE